MFPSNLSHTKFQPLLLFAQSTVRAARIITVQPNQRQFAFQKSDSEYNKMKHTQFISDEMWLQLHLPCLNKIFSFLFEIIQDIGDYFSV